MEQSVLLQSTTETEIIEEIKSPFISGTFVQYALDSTSIGWFKVCPRLYFYHMIEGWTSREESVHLRFGIEYHRALQDYEILIADGIEHGEAVFETVRQLLLRTDDFRVEHKYKNRNLLVRTVIWYLDKFGEDDPARTHILANGKPAVEVTFKFELDFGPVQGNGQPYLLCGHLDRVVRFGDDLFVMDRKTTTSTPGTYYFYQYEPNNQMTLYTLASQVVFESPIKGVIIDVAQVAIEFARFTRGFTYRTPEQIEEWLFDLRHVTAKMEEYATEGYWPMNDTACDKFGGCRFREICSRSPQVREQFLKSAFEKGEGWNPLKER